MILRKIICAVVTAAAVTATAAALPMQVETVVTTSEKSSAVTDSEAALQYEGETVYEAEDYTNTRTTAGFYQKQYSSKVFDKAGKYIISGNWDYSNVTDGTTTYMWIFLYDTESNKFTQVTKYTGEAKSGVHNLEFDFVPTEANSKFYIAVGGYGNGTLSVTDITVDYLPVKPKISQLTTTAKGMGECIYYEDFEFFDYGTYSGVSSFTGYDSDAFDFTVSAQQISKFEIVNVDGNSKLAITANGQFPQIKLCPNVKNKAGVYRVVAEFTNKSNVNRNGQIWVYADNIYNDDMVTKTTSGENSAVSLASGASGIHTEKWEIRGGESLSNVAFAIGSGNTASGDVLYIDNIAVYRMDAPLGEYAEIYGGDFTKDFGTVVFYDNFESSPTATAANYGYVNVYDRNYSVSYSAADGSPSLSIIDGKLVLTKTGVSGTVYPMFRVAFGDKCHFNDAGIYTVFYKYKVQASGTFSPNMQTAGTNVNDRKIIDGVETEDGFKFYTGYYIVEEGKKFSEVKLGAIIGGDTVMEIDEVVVCYKPFDNGDTTGAPTAYDLCSIRVKNPGGIRFKSFISTEKRALAEEYGYIVALEDTLNGAGITSADGFAGFTHSAGVKSIEGKAYVKGKNVDYIYEQLEEGIDFTGVLTGIDYSLHSATAIVTRPYVKIGRYYYYGQALARTPGYVAMCIKNDSEVYDALDDRGKAFVDQIIEYVGDKTLTY